MKKKWIFLFLLVSSFPLVSAQSLQIRDIISQVPENISDIFSPFFEVILGVNSAEFLFAKVLVLLLLFVIINAVLKRVELFERTKGAAFLVSLIVSILSVRFISDEGFISGILLPYGSLGVVVISIIPFLVYFWIVHKTMNSGFGRRIAWAIYGLAFILLWITRFGDISSVVNSIYIGGITVIGIAFFFDRDIHKYFRTARHSKLKRGFKLRQLADLEADLERYRKIQNPSDETERVIRDLEHRHRRLSDEL